MSLGFSTGLPALDSILEGAGTIYSKTLDRQIAKSNATAAQSNSIAEQYRSQALAMYNQAAGSTVSVGNVTFPTWVIPAGLVSLGLAYFLKKK
ncbi:MAG: hypothetical protein AAB276_06605 [Pseudomonadota bacterium]